MGCFELDFDKLSRLTTYFGMLNGKMPPFLMKKFILTAQKA